jgi:hypothetical protein
VIDCALQHFHPRVRRDLGVFILVPESYVLHRR